MRRAAPTIRPGVLGAVISVAQRYGQVVTLAHHHAHRRLGATAEYGFIDKPSAAVAHQIEETIHQLHVRHISAILLQCDGRVGMQREGRIGHVSVINRSAGERESESRHIRTRYKESLLTTIPDMRASVSVRT